MTGLTPKWLDKLEIRFGWLSVSNMAALLVGLQGIGFVLILSDPRWTYRLALIPRLVYEGEVWRIITFLALPSSMNPLGLVFILWFLYFVVSGIESSWGPFRTTFYVFLSVALSAGFSLFFMVPIGDASYIQSSLFLAAAALAPDFQILLFLVLPVKLVWLAWLTLGYILWQFAAGTWLDRVYLILIYANYLLFFGPLHAWQLKHLLRRHKFRRQLRR